MRPWLVLLLLAPLAMGGGPDDPEITDPKDDSTAGIGDIMAAWFEPVSSTQVDVIVRLAELTDQDSVRIEATWAITGPFNGTAEVGYGAQAWITPTGDRAQQIRPDSNGGPNLRLEVAYGAPAEVRIRGAWTGGIEWGGGTLTDFRVATHVAAPTDGITALATRDDGTHDEAGPGAAFELGLGGAGATKPWNITGPLRVQSPAESGVPGPADVTGLWVAKNGTGYDLTARIRSMTFEEAAACERMGVHSHIGGFQPNGIRASGYSTITFEAGWMVRQYDDLDASRTEDYDTVETLTFPYEVRWVFGTPGFFQIHAKDIDIDVAASPGVTIRCGDLDDSLRQEIGFGQILEEGAPFLLPVFFATVATIVGTLIVKKKQNRR